MQDKSKPTYVTSLDGLRALCALGVVGYHMNLTWSSGGFHGVTVLLVLSGYLITAGLLSEYFSCGSTRGRIDFLAFWKKRLWRLMPVVTAFIVVTAAVCVLFNHLLLTKMRPDILPAFFMVINWTKIFAQESYFVAAGAPSPLTHFWTLAIEAQFYLLWPLLLALILKFRPRKRTLSYILLGASILSAVEMAVLYVPGLDPTRVYYGLDTRAFNLLLGAWLAVMWPFKKMARCSVSDFEPKKQMLVKVGGWVCMLGLVAMIVFAEGYSGFSYRGGIALVTVLAVGAIAALTPSGTILYKIMSVKPLEWLGKRSYSIYIWHYPILELLNPRNATLPTPWWVLLLELALILVVADLSYRFIEKPFRHGWPVSGGIEGLRAWLKSHILATACVGVVSAVALVGCIVVSPVTVAGNAPDDKVVTQASLQKPLVDGVYDVVLIGDSVSLGANDRLNEAFPHGLIDSAGSRQADAAIEAYEGYRDQGVVGDTVVFSIGSNGVLDSDVMERIYNAVGPDKQLYFVNIRVPDERCEPNNKAIQECVDAHDNVHLIDWYEATKGHDDYLIADGIHLEYEGRAPFAQLIVDTIGYEVPTDATTEYSTMIIGDQICLDASADLAAAFPLGAIDSAQGRKTSAISQVFATYRDQNVVGGQVVFVIGNDEYIAESSLEDMYREVGTDRAIWFVNTRAPGTFCAENNKLLASFAQERDNVSVIDWYSASAGHDDYFAEDGMHLTAEGSKAFADCVVEGMGDEYGNTPQDLRAAGEAE